MPWREHLHSRMVAWLKVILPMAALALLSTLFLFSRNIDPTTTIPFTTIPLEERARDERVSRPEFAGATEDGDLISFHAASARPDPDHASRAFAEDLDARIDLTSGTVITFRARGGSVDEDADRAVLEGEVVVTSSTGYTVQTDKLISGMRFIRAETPGPVQGVGPPGTFSAGRMLITARETEGDEAAARSRPPVHLLFTDGVKLLYDPTKSEE